MLYSKGYQFYSCRSLRNLLSLLVLFLTSLTAQRVSTLPEWRAQCRASWIYRYSPCALELRVKGWGVSGKKSGVNLIEGFHLKLRLGFGRVFCKYLKHVFLYCFLAPSRSSIHCLLNCCGVWHYELFIKLGNPAKCWCTSQSEFSGSRRDGCEQKELEYSLIMRLLSTEVTVASIIHVNCVHSQMVNNSLWKRSLNRTENPLVIRKRWGATRSARLTLWEEYSAMLCIQQTRFHKTKFKHTDNVILLLFTFFRKLAELILCAVIEFTSEMDISFSIWLSYSCK